MSAASVSLVLPQRNILQGHTLAGKIRLTATQASPNKKGRNSKKDSQSTNNQQSSTTKRFVFHNIKVVASGTRLESEATSRAQSHSRRDSLDGNNKNKSNKESNKSWTGQEVNILEQLLSNGLGGSEPLETDPLGSLEGLSGGGGGEAFVRTPRNTLGDSQDSSNNTSLAGTDVDVSMEADGPDGDGLLVEDVDVDTTTPVASGSKRKKSKKKRATPKTSTSGVVDSEQNEGSTITIREGETRDIPFSYTIPPSGEMPFTAFSLSGEAFHKAAFKLRVIAEFTVNDGTSKQTASTDEPIAIWHKSQFSKKQAKKKKEENEGEEDEETSKRRKRKNATQKTFKDVKYDEDPCGTQAVLDDAGGYGRQGKVTFNVATCCCFSTDVFAVFGVVRSKIFNGYGDSAEMLSVNATIDNSQSGSRIDGCRFAIWANYTPLTSNSSKWVEVIGEDVNDVIEAKQVGTIRYRMKLPEDYNPFREFGTPMSDATLMAGLDGADESFGDTDSEVDTPRSGQSGASSTTSRRSGAGRGGKSSNLRHLYGSSISTSALMKSAAATRAGSKHSGAYQSSQSTIPKDFKQAVKGPVSFHLRVTLDVPNAIDPEWTCVLQVLPMRDESRMYPTVDFSGALFFHHSSKRAAEDRHRVTGEGTGLNRNTDSGGDRSSSSAGSRVSSVNSGRNTSGTWNNVGGGMTSSNPAGTRKADEEGGNNTAAAASNTSTLDPAVTPATVRVGDQQPQGEEEEEEPPLIADYSPATQETTKQQQNEATSTAAPPTLKPLGSTQNPIGDDPTIRNEDEEDSFKDGMDDARWKKDDD